MGKKATPWSCPLPSCEYVVPTKRGRYTHLRNELIASAATAT